MTDEMFATVLDTAQAKQDKEGKATLPEGRTLTLHGGHEGVSITVSKIQSVTLMRGVVRAQNAKGDLFLLALSDIFAAAIEGGANASAARKAGFLG